MVHLVENTGGEKLIIHAPASYHHPSDFIPHWSSLWDFSVGPNKGNHIRMTWTMTPIHQSRDDTNIPGASKRLLLVKHHCVVLYNFGIAFFFAVLFWIFWRAISWSSFVFLGPDQKHILYIIERRAARSGTVWVRFKHNFKLMVVFTHMQTSNHIQNSF